MIDILEWSFSDWFLAIVLCAVALNIFVFGMTFLVENRDVIEYNRSLRKRERKRKRTPHKDPKYSEIADWANEKLYYDTQIRGE